MKTKKEKLKEFHRKNILEVAKDLFISKGVIETTMDDIARKADYSKSTIYNYFKNKDEIYSYIVYENMELLKETLVRAIKNNKSFKSAFMAICDAHVVFQDKYPLYFESMIGKITEPNEGSDPIYTDILNLGDEINILIINFLNKGIQDKKVKPNIDPLQTAFILWAGICGLITMVANKWSTMKCLATTKEQFLKNGFKTYLDSILI